MAPTTCRTRSGPTRLAWLLLVLLFAAAQGWGEAIVAMEEVSLALALYARIFPGGRVETGQEGTVVVRPDGRRERFELSRADTVTTNGELWLVTSLNFPEAGKAIQAKLLTGGNVPDRSATCRIIMLRATGVVRGATPTVVAYQEALPDVASPLTICLEAYLGQPEGSPSAKPGPRWPRVSVVYGSFHERAGEIFGITWQAVLDGETLAWSSRLPVTLHRIGKDTWEDLTARQSGPDAVFTGTSTGRSFRVRCQLTSCRVTPNVVWEILP